MSVQATNVRGQFQAALKAEAGKSYVIEASSDLASWTEWGTATATGNGIEIVDDIASGVPRRFFRARLAE
jgi:hypothetical protein